VSTEPHPYGRGVRSLTPTAAKEPHPYGCKGAAGEQSSPQSPSPSSLCDRQVEVQDKLLQRRPIGAEVFLQPLMMGGLVRAILAPGDQLLPYLPDARNPLALRDRVETARKLFDLDLALPLHLGAHGDPELIAVIRAAGGRVRVIEPKDVAPDFVPALPRFFGDRLRGRIAQAGPPDTEGWITLELPFESLEAARNRILGFGRAVEVLEPQALRLSVLDFATQIVALYTRADKR
jgi:hypothetical protein